MTELFISSFAATSRVAITPKHQNVTSKPHELFVNLVFFLFSLHKTETKAAEGNIGNYHVQICLNWNSLNYFDMMWKKRASSNLHQPRYLKYVSKTEMPLTWRQLVSYFFTTRSQLSNWKAVSFQIIAACVCVIHACGQGSSSSVLFQENDDSNVTWKQFFFPFVIIDVFSHINVDYTQNQYKKE